MLQSYLLLDPQFRSSKEFLKVLYEMIVGTDGAELSEWQMKEGLKNILFELSVNKGKTVVLLIDEGQKLRHDGIELLRELLNYETNSSKLLQIVIFAQNEFKEALQSYTNFADRISTILYIGPFVFRETAEMIKFRIRETQKHSADVQLFTFGALRAIHKASGGYPRKIVIICHKALLQIIMEHKSKVSAKTIKKITNKERVSFKRYNVFYYAAGLVLFCAASIFLLDGFSSNETPVDKSQSPVVSKTELPEVKRVADTSVAPVIHKEVKKSVPLEQPTNLGIIRLEENTSLGSLLKRVYGTDRKSYRRIFFSSNHGVEQAEVLRKGMNVQFPLILQTPGNAFNGLFWLELASCQTLQEACASLQLQDIKTVPTALLASFTSTKGLRFSIVIKKLYASEKAALDILESLPPSVRVHSKIVRNWGERAILYTTPDAWPRESAKSALVDDQIKKAS